MVATSCSVLVTTRVPPDRYRRRSLRASPDRFRDGQTTPWQPRRGVRRSGVPATRSPSHGQHPSTTLEVGPRRVIPTRSRGDADDRETSGPVTVGLRTSPHFARGANAQAVQRPRVQGRTSMAHRTPEHTMLVPQLRHTGRHHRPRTRHHGTHTPTRYEMLRTATSVRTTQLLARCLSRQPQPRTTHTLVGEGHPDDGHSAHPPETPLSSEIHTGDPGVATSPTK